MHLDRQTLLATPVATNLPYLLDDASRARVLPSQHAGHRRFQNLFGPTHGDGQKIECCHLVLREVLFLPQ